MRRHIGLDWKIVGAALPGRDGVWDVGIVGDRIITLAPQIEAEADRLLEANGRLLIPALVDAHFHLDKALIYDRAPAQEGTFAEAMRETLRQIWCYWGPPRCRRRSP